MQALTGGETVIRFFLNLTGTPVGIETITIALLMDQVFIIVAEQRCYSASIQDAFTDKTVHITAASINSENNK